MIKNEYRGNRHKILKDIEIIREYFIKLPENEWNKQYKIVFSDIRSIPFNNYIHAVFNLIKDEMGEGSLEDAKNIIKEAVGAYDDHKVQDLGVTFITRKYHKTSEMSSKELAEFMLKVETWAFHDMNGLTFNHLKTN